MHHNYKTAIFLAVMAMTGQSVAASKPAANREAGSDKNLKTCASVVVDPTTHVTLGKSTIVKLSAPATRMVVGGQSSNRAGRPVDIDDKNGATNKPAMQAQNEADGVADVQITLLSPTELFFLGKKTGSMNVILQSDDGRCHVKDIIVTMDPSALQSRIAELMPEETEIKVRGSDNSLVLTGRISDAMKLDEVMSLATSFCDGKKVINLLRINTPQQVMLEVKIAEVSKTLLDRFGLDFARLSTNPGNVASRMASGIIGGASGIFGDFTPQNFFSDEAGKAAARIGGGSATAELHAVTTGGKVLGIDAQKKDGLVRVLAEPNIMAISGQQASFLSGGKIFIPVAQSNTSGGTTITLEEKEFGVGLKFMPTVLDGTRINLKLVSEVSELSQTGSPFTTVSGVTAVLPSMATRRADTTVQLNDGQSFVIAGLIKNNITETISRFPGMGEVPVLGALFRSTEFQNDQTELVFVVTPRLVKPLSGPVTLPTDNHIVPTWADVMLMGKSEGKAKEAAPAPTPTTTLQVR